MDEIKLEQLEEMQKDLFKKQCDLDIQKAFVKHFIKKKQSEQLTIPVVVKSLPTVCKNYINGQCTECELNEHKECNG